jgi:hypothetical protein
MNLAHYHILLFLIWWTMKELKPFYFLYTWTTAFLAPLVIRFNDFLVLFSPSYEFFLYTSYVFGLRF